MISTIVSYVTPAPTAPKPKAAILIDIWPDDAESLARYLLDQQAVDPTMPMHLRAAVPGIVRQILRQLPEPGGVA